MRMVRNYRFEYMCFIVWSHGIKYIDEMLSSLERDCDFELLYTRRVSNFNHDSFIKNIYECDAYPIEHLVEKSKYLKALPAEAIFIFVKCFDTTTDIVGAGTFRSRQSRKIVAFKKKFRDLYNPRMADGSLSHQHIIHGTDDGAQTDYLLKLLGHEQGIRIFKRPNIPFSLPYHIPWTGKYKIITAQVSSLKASILHHDAKGVKTTITPICETPHFLGINNEQIYSKYLMEFLYTYLCDFYSLDKYRRLQKCNIIAVLRNNPIVTHLHDDCYLILDGVHRAAVTLHNRIEKIPMVVFQ